MGFSLSLSPLQLNPSSPPPSPNQPRHCRPNLSAMELRFLQQLASGPLQGNRQLLNQPLQQILQSLSLPSSLLQQPPPSPPSP